MAKQLVPVATPIGRPTLSAKKKTSPKHVENVLSSEPGPPSRLLGIVVGLMIILISTIVILYYIVLTCDAPGAIIIESGRRRDTLSEYLKSVVDLDLDPCNDFYGYTCGGYLRRARNLNKTKATTANEMYAENVKWLSSTLLRPIKEDDDIALKLSKTFYKSCYIEGTTGNYSNRAAEFNALLMGVEKTAGIPFPYRISDDPVANARPGDNVNALLAADTFSISYARILIEFAPAYKQNVLNLFELDMELTDDGTARLGMTPPAFLRSICSDSTHGMTHQIHLVNDWILGTLNDSRTIFEQSPELSGGRLNIDAFASDLLNFVQALATYFCTTNDTSVSLTNSNTRMVAQLSYRYLNVTAFFGELRRLGVSRHDKTTNFHYIHLGDPLFKLAVHTDYFVGIEELLEKGSVSTRQLIAVLYYNVFFWHASGWRRFTSRAVEMNTMRPYMDDTVLKAGADGGGRKRQGVNDNESDHQRFRVDWERDERRRRSGRSGIAPDRLHKRDVNGMKDGGKKALAINPVDVVVNKCAALLKKELRGAVDYIFVIATPPTERKSARRQLSTIVDYVRQGFHSLLFGTRWLDVTSRAMAVRKLNTMHIALPNTDALAAAADELWSGMRNVIIGGGAGTKSDSKLFEKKLLSMDYRRLAICATLARLRKQLGLVVQQVTVQDYFETVVLEQQSTMDVNAMYFTSRNTLIINAGIYRLPLFDSYWPMEWNFGALGSVIGHEISHAFDSYGMNFNELGEWEPWFNNSVSVAEFNNFGECIADEYSAFCRDDDVASGVCIDGHRTMAENLADNAGLHAAFRGFIHYLTTSLNLRYRFDEPKFQRLINGQLFFVAFTQVWCSYMHNGDQIRFDDGDVHSPDVYRPLGTLRNNPSFGNIYNCTSGNIYYPENYCHVW